MTEISKEYAEALFALALESGVESELLQKLNTVKSLLDENPEYREFLSSPGIPMCDRIQGIESTFQEILPEFGISFMCLLCEKGRITLFDECIVEYEKLLNAKDKVITAKVTSAVVLTEDEKKRLVDALSKKSGSRVEIICKTDENVLGGIIVEMDGMVMDGSIRHRLRDIKDVLIDE